MKIRVRELRNMGIPPGDVMDKAKRAAADAAHAGVDARDLKKHIASVVESPDRFTRDKLFGDLARGLLAYREAQARYKAPPKPAAYASFASEDVEREAVQQLENACSLPVTVSGALMPDAHVGYGLPIGGVLATRNAVIPYAVGVDIACRMKLSVLDMPINALERNEERLVKAINDETRFGIGASFKHPRHHEVMDRDWSVSKVTKVNRDKAWAQLGTSGSGNHFVEYGVLRIDDPSLGLEPGEYLALLSHSGSRGAGASVADYYSRLAMQAHPELPNHLRHLAWLDLDSAEGLEYWEAMELMGEYAKGNHACIHRHIAKNLGAHVLLDVENHHNFAWKERHGGREVVVHRKGATPAGAGVLGVIPGSMASPAYIVRGKGNAASLDSAAHGAGRVMSRKRAKEQFNWHQTNELLKERGVKLLSAGLDEVPMAYRDIRKVMASQRELVEPLAEFHPRLVKMAPAGERPED